MNIELIPPKVALSIVNTGKVVRRLINRPNPTNEETAIPWLRAKQSSMPIATIPMPDEGATTSAIHEIAAHPVSSASGTHTPAIDSHLKYRSMMGSL